MTDLRGTLGTVPVDNRDGKCALIARPGNPSTVLERAHLRLASAHLPRYVAVEVQPVTPRKREGLRRMACSPFRCGWVTGTPSLCVARRSSPGGTQMIKIIYAVIIYGLIPAILIMYFVISARLPSMVEDSEVRLSARAGFWAGVVIFAAYCVIVIPGIDELNFDVDSLPSFNLWGALLGLATGFVFLRVLEIFLPSRGIGILTLIMAAASAIALFSYLFQADARDFTMYLTLGALFGGLLNVVLFPSLAKSLLSRAAG
jgi:hypothetical protein